MQQRTIASQTNNKIDCGLAIVNVGRLEGRVFFANRRTLTSAQCFAQLKLVQPLVADRLPYVLVVRKHLMKEALLLHRHVQSMRLYKRCDVLDIYKKIILSQL